MDEVYEVIYLDDDDKWTAIVDFSGRFTQALYKVSQLRENGDFERCTFSIRPVCRREK